MTTDYMVTNARVQNANTGIWETRFMLYFHSACNHAEHRHTGDCWQSIAQSTSHTEIERYRQRHHAALPMY